MSIKVCAVAIKDRLALSLLSLPFAPIVLTNPQVAGQVQEMEQISAKIYQLEQAQIKIKQE